MSSKVYKDKHNNIINEERFNLETKNKLDSIENLKSKQILEAENLIATKEKQNLRIILFFLYHTARGLNLRVSPGRVFYL